MAIIKRGTLEIAGRKVPYQVYQEPAPRPTRAQPEAIAVFHVSAADIKWAWKN